MPNYNIEHNGKLACFSSISDSFVTKFMDKDAYEKWLELTYGTMSYKHTEQPTAPIEYAVHSIRLNRNRDKAMKCLLECGLSEDECEELMDNIEKKYYYPRLQEDGTYLCPNCKTTVIEGQEKCNERCCEIELVWKK